LDTHAGNGCYDIQEQSHHDEVTARFLQETPQTPAIIVDYMRLIKPYMAKLNYPGSPLVVWEMLGLLAREKGADQNTFAHANMHISELHPSAYSDLKQWTSHSEFHCHHRDGFELLNALTPPKPNRGLVLIDPPYEQVGEYEQVLESIKKALSKWQNGIYAIWYPLLSQQRIDRVSGDTVDTPKHGLSEKMLLAFTDLAAVHKIGLLDIQFAQQTPNENVGMYGSGMVVFNPPWQVDSTLKSALEYLKKSAHASASDLSKVSMLVDPP
jgi:23S rRNA (adenine2030-N6)-methyltransferase